ncbi:MAG: N-succinyl-L,L-diaminopimelate desuccinylase (EC [uncultured Campylobacterales bacterium]|uniref:Succinyl-diaminopimelate desuccinylase n=1 Tax=uncultured Campylobacterales bacterium TaxID=352960 RepID=A0A6S6SPX8_9BACT|nr:MAG: N-succinyl-L,L-diaminopimelate desuccinylase (EC [uncultured Campylobacterales bacterium]
MELIPLFKKILSYKTLTPDEDGFYDFLKSYLSDFIIIENEKNSVKNIFLYKKYSEGPHLCFAGHIDVVPAGDNWKTDPFIPHEEDGYIYARGAQDMKSGLTCFIKAIKDTKTFNGTLSLLITSDEEGPGIDGTQYMLKVLKEKNLLPDMGVVAEPTCSKILGDTVKIGRRGSINGIINIIGKQTHAAYPEKGINPINIIAPLLSSIAGVKLDDGDDSFDPSLLVITDIRGGMEVTNVTPANVKIMFNVRNSTKTSKEKLKTFIESKLKDINYTLELTQGSFPFVTQKDSKLVKVVQNSIKEVTNIEPTLSTTGGTSDARYFAPHNIPTVEFGVINDTIHAINERTSIKEVNQVYEIFKDVISKI